MCIHNSNLNNCAACLGQASQQQYQANVYFGATGSGSVQSNSDYQMFLKYAELSDGELMNSFYDEEKCIKDKLEMQIEVLKAQAEIEIAVHRMSFIKWVSKYRKQITEKRLNDLKAFL